MFAPRSTSSAATAVCPLCANFVSQKQLTPTKNLQQADRRCNPQSGRVVVALSLIHVRIVIEQYCGHSYIAILFVFVCACVSGSYATHMPAGNSPRPPFATPSIQKFDHHSTHSRRHRRAQAANLPCSQGHSVDSESATRDGQNSSKNNTCTASSSGADWSGFVCATSAPCSISSLATAICPFCSKLSGGRDGDSWRATDPRRETEQRPVGAVDRIGRHAGTQRALDRSDVAVLHRGEKRIVGHWRCRAGGSVCVASAVFSDHKCRFEMSIEQRALTPPQSVLVRSEFFTSDECEEA